MIEELGGVRPAVWVLLEAHFDERDSGSADLRCEGVVVGIALADHLLERVSIVCWPDLMPSQHQICHDT